jgi:hypothetical protein|uniref:Uncharacterized protein n=1 Tax=viral metagenome TaxID=1070528 RepID=A0A6C0IRD1_9ZZZZ
MATTLIDTRKPIMAQITHSWNQFRTDKDSDAFLWSNDDFEVPFAKDFAEKDAPWSSKQTVLERNAVHANKLIRLYIALNIETAERMHIWQFFEISAGVVGKIKEKIKLLKRVTRVLKKQQEYGMDLSNATDLYLWRKEVSLYTTEVQLKEYSEKMKEKKARRDCARFVKNIRLKEAEEKKQRSLKDVKKFSRKTIAMLKKAHEEGYSIQDVISELEK